MLRRLLFAWLLLVAGVVHAAAHDSGLRWNQLSALQRTALAPLQHDWPRFSADRKRKWLDIAQRYAAMSPAQQSVLHKRMSAWIRMTPEQRRRARENFLAAGRAPQLKRQRAWQRYQRLPAAQRHALARQAHQPPRIPGRVAQYGLRRPAAAAPGRVATPTAKPGPAGKPAASATAPSRAPAAASAPLRMPAAASGAAPLRPPAAAAPAASPPAKAAAAAPAGTKAKPAAAR